MGSLGELLIARRIAGADLNNVRLEGDAMVSPLTTCTLLAEKHQVSSLAAPTALSD